MEVIYSSLNNLVAGSLFILSTYICECSLIAGLIGYVISFAYLDLHSYIEKKLNYPNNLFINSSKL